MSDKQITKLSWGLVILSLLLIIGALFAPSIFTQKSEYFDFTETGQIGDTIGGIITPIVSISGVLMTFVAFLLQVRANEMQRDQLRKSFNLNLLEQQLKSRNSLQLSSLDIKIMINAIDATVEEIDKFCKETALNPTGETALQVISNKSYERFFTIDRNLLFDSFQSFVDEKDNLKLFRNLYSIMDYYSDGLKMIYKNIYNPYSQDIMTIKYKIPQSFEHFMDKIYQTDYDPKFTTFNNFIKEIEANVIKNGVLNIASLINILNDSEYEILYQDHEDAYQELLGLTNSLITQNKMLVASLKEAINKMSKSPQYTEIKKISDIIDKALENNTIETIQKDFSQKI